MKHLSLILNSVLILSVGILFYLHFSSNKKTPAITRTPVTVNPGSKQLIAYIDMDSLNEYVSYIKSSRLQSESEQKSIESEVENGYKGLEKERNDFLKKGDKITQEEAERFQAMLYEKQAAIDSRKQSRLQQLDEKNYKLLEDLQSKLKAFLEEYNDDKRYSYILTVSSAMGYIAYKDTALNITNDVIKGMNERLNKSDR